jgi:hypothetical protein
MATQVQWRGGSTAEHATFTGAAREVTVDTQKQTLVVHDGSTVGGAPLQKQYPPLGSAAAPTFTFSGDTNTGIYSPGADQVAVSTGGTGRLFVDASGNIKVSTGEISQTSAGGYIRLDGGTGSGNGANVLVFGESHGAAPGRVALSAVGVGAITASTGGAERLRITSGGLVGIGTSAPGYKLELADSNPTFGIRTSLQSASSASTILFRNKDGNGNDYDISKVVAASVGNGGYGELQFYTTFNNTLAQRAVIDREGRLGIGTASPSNLLHLSAAGTSYLQIQNTSAGNNFYVGNSAGTGIFELTGSNQFKFISNSSDRVVIDSSGRLLIGTSTWSGDERVVIYNNPSSSGPGYLGLATGTASPANGINLGAVIYAASDGGNTAAIRVKRDGGSWTNGASTPTRMEFSTTADGASTPTERMRIHSTGQIGSFAADGSPSYTIRNATGAGTATVFIQGLYSATGTTSGGTASVYVFTNGNIQNTNNSYTAISDIKLKENIVDAGSQWSDIKALQVRNYNLKEGQTHRQIGLIAQEVEPISPGLVYESPDRDDDGNDLGTVTKGVNYSVLYMKAVKALQEAMERIETLEGMVAVNNITIDEQQHQLSTLAARLTALETP